MKPIRVALIPAYQPDETLLALVKELSLRDFFLIVVNDGSGADFEELFSEVSRSAVVLQHHENQGRAASMHTGMAYLREHFPFHYTAVTLDCDGRHRICDAEHLCRVAEENRDALVWGTRIFSRKTPLKVKLGNKLDCLAVKLSTGISVRDTDSGLCAFSDLLTEKMLDAPEGKDGFERRLLRCCKRAHIPVPQVKVRNRDIEEA